MVFDARIRAMSQLDFLLTSLLIYCIALTSACPPLCSCKWKNGKQTVECTNKDLEAIPAGIDPETQVLDFTENNLPELSPELFARKQLINLQRLYLSHCKIKIINEYTFKGLTNLVDLDLSGNLLGNVPGPAFRYCASLMRLSLSFNPIESVKKFDFQHLVQLTNLELSDCLLEEVEEGAFHGLGSLEWLRLGGNRLRTIRGRYTIPGNVKGVELEKNVWECDCNMREFHAWLRGFAVPLSTEPVCSGPERLTGVAIRSIGDGELACLPEVSPTTFYLELGEGKNVSLVCHVRAVPEAAVSWWFQGQMLQNNTVVAPGVHLIYFLEEGAESKHSELFIYNTNIQDNGTFVCRAENPAGVTQANFTIRVLLKEEPIVIIVSFPLEYFLFVAVAAGILGLLIIITLMVLIIRCRRRRRRQLKHDEAVCQQNSKCTEEDDALSCNSQSKEVLSPVNQVSSPSFRCYQVEQNPDLINGTESKAYRLEGDGEDMGFKGEQVVRQMIPLRDLYLVDLEGCVVDHPLLQCNESFYRTLPNRMKRNSPANPLNRYSRGKEFLSRSVDSPYEYNSNVRYTADGYPARAIDTESVRSDSEAPASLPCPLPQWPRCVPANLHSANYSVSAQTQTQSDIKSQADILSESPDEGYEGEPTT